MTERELLAGYVAGSGECFAKLVALHVNLVYSVALRQVGDWNAAEDVTQEVFLRLARKAKEIEPEVPLAGWLFTTTRLVSLQAKRGDARRKRREQEAAMNESVSTDPTWGLIAEDIDKAVADLSANDRDALLLRYFSGKTHPEIAAILAISEEAAKKRVQRGLDALQVLLTSRGVATGSVVTAVTLAGALSRHAVQAAPPALASTVTSAVAAKGAGATVAAKGATMTAAKAGLIGVAAVGVIVGSAGVAMYLSKSPVGAAAPMGGGAVAVSEPVAAESAPNYLSAYALPPGRVIANFPDLDPAARQAAFDAVTAGRIPGKPVFMLLKWTGNSLSYELVTTGGPAALPVRLESIPLDRIFGIQYGEVASALTVPKFPGDIVYRAGATEEEYLASLGEMASAQLNRPIKCAIRQQVMDVVVLKGTYRYTPVADLPADDKGMILLYVDSISADPGGDCGTISTAQGFARDLSLMILQPVAIECPNFPHGVGYRNTQRLGFGGTSEQRALFLQNVATQMGLSVSHEKRLIRCLFVENAEDHLKVDAWNEYPHISPFEGVRWIAELPEVAVDGKWYGLVGVGNYSVERLVGFAKESAPQDWKKRFEEDFVALVGLMGVEVDREVVPLWLKDLETGKVRMREVAMTEEKRRAVMEGRRELSH